MNLEMLRGRGWFDALAHHYQLRRLQRIRRELALKIGRDLEEARKGGASRDAVEKMLFDDQANLDLIDDDIAQLVSDRLRSLADHYLIPLPPAVVIYEGDTEPDYPKDWEPSRVTNRYRLTAAAAVELRAAIRKEQREGSELVFRWLSSLTGIIGALIGLVALLTRHGH